MKRIWLLMDAARAVGGVSELGFRHRTVWAGEKFKLKGGAVVVANHTSFGDPFLIWNVFWYRRVFMLASEAVMRTGLRYAVLREAGCVKIDRKAIDLRAVREATELIREGRVVALFPQGAIRREGDTDAVKSGAVLIALQGNVPLVPVYSRLRRHWWQRRTVVVGEPMDCRALCGKEKPSVADVAALTEELHRRLAACKAIFDQREEKR